MEKDPFAHVPVMTSSQLRLNRWVLAPFLALLSLGLAAIVEADHGPGWQTLQFSLPLLVSAVIAGRELTHWMQRVALRRMLRGEPVGDRKGRMRWVGAAAAFGGSLGLPLAKATDGSTLFPVLAAVFLAGCAGMMWARIPAWLRERRLPVQEVETLADRA